MSRWALVQNSLVMTITEQDDQPTIVIPQWPDGVWIQCPDWVGSGDTYVNGEFVKTNPPPLVLLITKAAMIERFTIDEYAGIVTASNTDAQVKAWYDWLNAATVVQVDGARVADGLTLLVNKNLLTEQRKTEIINAPTLPTERP